MAPAGLCEMRLTLAYPDNGTQVCIDIDEPAILANLYDKRLGQDIDGKVLGNQFEGYQFRIGGGNDKQGFPMKQGVITPRRVRLLLKAGSSCYRPRKDGERKRKTVRGCIVSSEISALHLIVLQKGTQEIKGLTDIVVPRRFGPKRASKIRALFNLDNKADLTQHVLRRQVKEGKFVSPKIQRLITPHRIARKARMLKEREDRKKRSQARADAYKAMTQKKSN